MHLRFHDITDEDLAAWRGSRVTQYVFARIDYQIRQEEESLGRGNTLGNTPVVSTAKAVGKIQGLKLLNELTRKVGE